VAFHKANANLEQRLVVSFRQLVQNYTSGRISQSVKHRIEVRVVTDCHVPSFYATMWLRVKYASKCERLGWAKVNSHGSFRALQLFCQAHSTFA
jgi:hypothetical protein